MDSIIHHEVKIPPEEDITGCVCRFCMLPCEEYDVLRIPWNEWEHSLLAAMYERIMNQALYISKDCSEFCCNKCSQLLSQTVATIDMCERSDTIWRGILIVSPKSECIEFSDDQYAHQSNQKSTLIDIEFMKIESVDDFRSEFGEITNSYLDTANDDEPVMIEKLDILPEVPKLQLSSNKQVGRKKYAGNNRVNKSSKGVVTTDELFPCSVCNEICRTRNILTRHMSKIHSIKMCAQCEYTTPDRLTLQRHYIGEHKRNRSIDTISACTECGKVCINPLSLKAHMKIVHGPLVPSQCHICSKVFRNHRRLQKHVVTHAEPSFQCDICSKMFRLKKYIIWHIKNTHSKTINFICSKCGKNYKDYTALKLHEKKYCSEIHEKLKTRPGSLTMKVSCSLCNRKFSAAAIGRRHYREEHQIVDMSVVCTICNHLASSKDDLRVHQDEKHIQLRCSMCMRFCISEFSLQLHIATHSTKERSFECSICEATFLKLPDLNLHHKRAHTSERPFKCPDCDLRFVAKCEMNIHWRHKHEEVKKFKCQWCDKTYAAIGELRKHETKHTGIGHKRCNFCNEHFRNLPQLTKHMNTFHPDWRLDQNCSAVVELP